MRRAGGHAAPKKIWPGARQMPFATSEADVLHVKWSGDTCAARQRSEAPAAPAPWIEPTVVKTGSTVVPEMLYAYRIKERLTVSAMCARLKNIVTEQELRQIELGQAPVPARLQRWLTEG